MKNYNYEIVLIEDNPDDANLTLRELRKNKLIENCILIKDGEDALQFFFGELGVCVFNEGNLPKLVLLDLKIPKIGGLDVLKALSENAVTALMPVVVFTSSGEINDILNAYRNGANSYIVKPVDFNKFRQTITEVLNYWLVHNSTCY